MFRKTRQARKAKKAQQMRQARIALVALTVLGVPAMLLAPAEREAKTSEPVTVAQTDTPVKRERHRQDDDKQRVKRTPSPTVVTEPGCEQRKHAVKVELDKYPNIVAHVREAIAAGQPVVLHIDRLSADAHRDAATSVLPTKDGYDRDEYPPAMSREGGAGADVEYVESSENSAAGASMGNQLSGYCNGQKFKIAVNTPEPEPVPVAPEPEPVQEVYYANCTEAIEAGAAPLTAGDPGFDSSMDRDGDGVACDQ